MVALWIGLCAGSLQAQDQAGATKFLGGSVRDTWGGAELRLELSHGVPWRVFTLTAPDRIVVDFGAVDWQGADPESLRRGDRISALRFGGFRLGMSRLVAVLDRPMAVEKAGLSVNTDNVNGGGAAELVLSLGNVDRAAFDASAGAPQDPRWDLPPAAAVRAAPKGPGPVVVMIDPGHGGIDPGAEADGVNEAGLVLAFAQELREVLLRAGGFEVVMTRDADTFVSLEGRVALAHAAGADVFISLHADSIDEGIARGAAIYTLAEKASDAASAALAERHDRDDLLAGIDLNGSDDRVARVLMDLARLDNAPRSRALAADLLAGIRSNLGEVHKRPLRQAGFSVLKAADIPSVLIELGFLSTAGELRNLQDSAWRERMSAGIRDGLQSWVQEDAALAGLRRQ
ncbi:MAG: N-acetylmuramoyl-L-alanine amidase [Rhodobacterales bacterium]|nr:N-acetylmuramoyl-L-alanine amidase [Puniceibacterium antarcticum]